MSMSRFAPGLQFDRPCLLLKQKTAIKPSFECTCQRELQQRPVSQAAGLGHLHPGRPSHGKLDGEEKRKGQNGRLINVLANLSVSHGHAHVSPSLFSRSPACQPSPLVVDRFFSRCWQVGHSQPSFPVGSSHAATAGFDTLGTVIAFFLQTPCNKKLPLCSG